MEDTVHGQPTPQRLEPSVPVPVKPSPVNSSPAQQRAPAQNLALNTSIPLDGPSPSWPDRPAVSPITPTSEEPQAQAQAQPQPQPQSDATATISDPHNPPPPPPPHPPKPNLNLSENPDAIALSTAISILQIQRQQTITDIQTLNRLKTAALNDPQGFLTDLKDKNLAHSSQPSHERDVDVADQDRSETQDPTSPPRKSAFPAIPPAQSIIRTPPINWEKYHIVGPSLDKLHSQQQLYPGITDTQIQQSGHPPKHEIAAPYRPGIDRLEEKGSK